MDDKIVCFLALARIDTAIGDQIDNCHRQHVKLTRTIVAPWRSLRIQNEMWANGDSDDDDTDDNERGKGTRPTNNANTKEARQRA